MHPIYHYHEYKSLRLFFFFFGSILYSINHYLLLKVFYKIFLSGLIYKKCGQLDYVLLQIGHRFYLLA